MRKFILAATAIATLLPAVPAMAGGQYYSGYDRYRNRQYDRDYNGYYRDRDGYYSNRYGNRYNTGYYGQTWRGRDGLYYCRRSDGTTGTLVGAIGGGVLGGAIGGDALGAIVGAGAGALLGRSIDRGSTVCH